VGRATAVAFGRRGDRVALLARGEEGLGGASREVAEAGGTPLPVACDVSDADAVERAGGQAEERFGPVDVWVNCAMSSVLAFVHETDPADARRVMEVSYSSTCTALSPRSGVCARATGA
jgi:NAD(P)-dependent dehydrogenase (short-subunit alcohol dehydrogenase family)